MILSVGDFRKSYHLWLWVLLINHQRATVIGQLSPSYSDNRQFYSNGGIQEDDYALRPNSKHVEDYAAQPPPAAEYYDESLYQHKLNDEIVPDYYGKSSETHQGYDNKKRVISDRFKSEENFEQNNVKTFQKLKNPSGDQQFKQNKVPIKYAVLKRPLRTRGMYTNVYYEPYRIVPSSNTQFQGLGDQRNSKEIINQLIGGGGNNIGLGNKNQLKNAYLTKVTSYNITQLKGQQNNERFLLEKKANSTSDIRYLDSNNRTTNYSDIYSSSLKTVLQPEKQVYENISHLEPPSRTFNNNKRKKVQEDEENNQRKANSQINIPKNTVLSESNNVRDDKLTKDIMSQKNGEPNNLYSHETGENKEIHHILDQYNTSRNEGTKNIADDFVGGQYVSSHDKQNISSLGSTQPYEYKGHSDSTSDQYISDPENKYDFVSGQFTDILGNSSSEFRTAPTSLITTDNTIADFVSGQFLRHSSEEELTPTYSENKKNPTETVGGQRMNNTKSNNEEVTEKDDYENNVFINTYINDTESTEFSKQSTVMPEVITNFDVGLATKSNFYMNEPKESINFDNTHEKDKLLNKNNYLSASLFPDQLKTLNLYNKELTTQYDYNKLLTSPAPGEEFPTITYHTKKKEDAIESKILSDKKQLSPPMVLENYEGMSDYVSILGDSQTKTGIKSKESIHKDKNGDSTLNVDKDNNKNATDIEKKKISGPIVIPYVISRIPSRGMSTDPKILTRPINVISVGNDMYVPQFPLRTKEQGKPNNQDNVVFQANDGDTEVIVSISTSPPYDTLQNNLPISDTNSSEESQTIVNYEHDGFSKNNEEDTLKTKRPHLNTKNKTPNSEYDEYEEDDGILRNSNTNKSYSILEMDPNTSHYITELVANYFKSEFTTEPNDIKDRVNIPFEDDRGLSSASTAKSDVTIDSIVGESSDILPNHLIPQSPTSLSLLNIDGKSYDEQNIPSQNLSDPTNMSDDVELYVGNSLSTILNNKGSPVTDINSNFHRSDNIKLSEEEPDKSSHTKKGHLAELCIPLRNEKYISLLDLLSGPFYFDRNGKKVAFTVRGDHKKNCNLRSKQCKLFIDLKNISNTLNPDNPLELNKEEEHLFQKSKHEKRHITQDLTLNPQQSYSNTKELSSYNYKTEQVDQSNEEKSNWDIRLSDNLKRSFLDPNLKTAFDAGRQSFSIIYKDKKRSQDLHHSSDAIPTRFNSHTTAYPNENSFDMRNYNSESIQLGSHIHKRRPARTIDSGRSDEGEKCGCGENQILKSPSPLPHYKEFVSKRYDILKNIVHTVGDWAANS